MRSATLAVLLTLVGASSAHAERYDLVWETVSYRGSRGSTSSATIIREGETFFSVNAIPIPTYTTPGAYRALNNGDLYNAFQAPFDSVLLRPSTNNFFFGVTTQGGNSSTFTTELVRLLRPAQPPLPLFFVHRDGTDFTGNTSVSFGLRELNPGLADRIVAMEKALSEDRNKLLGNALRIADLDVQQARLDSLQAELNTLLQKGFDDLTAAELDALLARYVDVPAGTRKALVELVADLKKGVEQLRTEISRITNELGLHVDEAGALVEAAVAQAGHDLSTPESFNTDGGLSEMPDVTVPEIVPNGDFDPAHDPYAAFAQTVMTRLAQQVVSGTVRDRLGFLSTVRSWRANVEAMRRALESRAAVSNEEWGAFLNARQSVAVYVRDFVDEDGWFLDSPVPQDMRNRLDTVLMGRIPKGATALKEALSGWGAEPMTPEQKLLLDAINALLNGASAAIFGTVSRALSELMQLTESLATAVIEVTRVVVGFTPAGDALDFCEAVSGRTLCMPGGLELSTEERLASGLGVVIGSGAFWRAAANVVHIGPRLGRILDNLVVDLGEAEANLLRTRLGHNTLAHLENVTGRQIKDLADRYGDKFVSDLASSVGGGGLVEVTRLDLFQRLFSERVRNTIAKNGAAVRNLPVFSGQSLDEVRGVLGQQGFVQKAADNVQEVWTHADGSVIRIAPNGTGARPNRPHLKKEISHTPHQYGDADIACKVTDSNVLVPQGQNEATNGFNQWFRRAVMAKTEGYVRDMNAKERELLLTLWADATHIDITH